MINPAQTLDDFARQGKIGPGSCALEKRLLHGPPFGGSPQDLERRDGVLGTAGILVKRVQQFLDTMPGLIQMLEIPSPGDAALHRQERHSGDQGHDGENHPNENCDDIFN